LLLWTIIILTITAPLFCQAVATGDAHHDQTGLDERLTRDDCSLETQSFPLNDQDLTIINTGSAILFTAGMTIDADGAPNAYAPHDGGLDYTANARGPEGWVALVTNENGRPVIQKTGPYRGYYISTTSLAQRKVRDVRSPKRYIDARTVPYIALPPDFTRMFGIRLGDLAVVVNQGNGRSAYAIFADVSPRGKIGEGSIALAKALGIPANPRHDGIENGITYLVFPGSAAPAGGRVTARSIRLSTARVYQRWGGRQKMQPCQAALSSQDN
jgi:hypothetical protein